MLLKNNPILYPLAAVLMTAGLMPSWGEETGQPTAPFGSSPETGSAIELNDREYFQARGVNVLAFSNPPGGLFFDAKTSGIEIIHHGERTATNGDVRLLPTPEQWDGMGQLVEREVDRTAGAVIAHLAYPEHDFQYRVKACSDGETIRLSVHLDQPLPAGLQGKAGFNMEFLPSVYWDKTYLADGKPGSFPRSAGGPMTKTEEGRAQPQPLVTAATLVLAPESSERRITIREITGANDLMLYDGRAMAQNGWYVVRSLIPPLKTGKVVEWELDIHGIPGWVREPVIGHSQVGYHPAQTKQAVLELDPDDEPEQQMTLLRVKADGSSEVALTGAPEPWGQYLRYDYLRFDFSQVREPGVYQLQYGDQITKAFRIDDQVYAGVWQPTLDVFFPVQMDHMLVREAYRVWHGRSHMDDALQAPPNYEHFDLYAHGAETDTDFETFEHIPGLAIGGWYDAGDYDIRTQSQYHTVQGLVHAWEQFAIERDNTYVSHEKRYVQINYPDGKEDVLQQIEHGALQLVAQHRAVGHAIPGIVAGRLYQYPHLGDGSTKTDNLIYDPKLDPHADERVVGEMYEPSTVDPTPLESVMKQEGDRSGRFDDRWAFTTNTTALNYGSAAALAAASRALSGYNDELAEECLATARRVWEYETDRSPNTYRFGNTTGGRLEEEKLKAAVELLLATEAPKYAEAVRELLPQLQDRFEGENVAMFVLALPRMDETYSVELERLTLECRERIRQYEQENPYGVPITRGGWAGNGAVIRFGITNYWLRQAFPDIVEKELVYRSLNYLFGTHPDSNYSFVSGVGADSQTNAYGMNRADFSFIPGGVVPGVLVLPPDYPENKSDWPFFWGQNEYVIPMGSMYLFLAHAVQKLLAED